MSSHLVVLDVSNVNPISWQQLREARPAALIAKATEGSSFVDRTLGEHRNLASRARIPFGSYLFLRVGSTGSEAGFYLAHAHPRRGDLQPIIDAEDMSQGAQALARRADACRRAFEHAGYRPILYCSASVWPQLVAERPGLRGLYVWEADYPGRFTRWTPGLARLRIRLRRGASVCMWQWTDRYLVGGRGFDASRLFVPLERLLIP